MVETEVVARPLYIALGTEQKTVGASPTQTAKQFEEFGEPQTKAGSRRGLPCHNNIHLFISTGFSRGKKAEEDGTNFWGEAVNSAFFWRYHFNI